MKKMFETMAFMQIKDNIDQPQVTEQPHSCSTGCHEAYTLAQIFQVF